MQNLRQDISSFRQHVSSASKASSGNGNRHVTIVPENTRKRTLATINVGDRRPSLQRPVHLAEHKAGSGQGETKQDREEVKDEQDEQDQDQVEPESIRGLEADYNAIDNGAVDDDDDKKADRSEWQEQQEQQQQQQSSDVGEPDAKSAAPTSTRASTRGNASARGGRGRGAGRRGGHDRTSAKRRKYTTNYGGQYESDPHHVESYDNLDAKEMQQELNYINSNKYVLLLYKFCRDIAGSEHEHSKRCGHTRPLVIGTMWNLDKHSYGYSNRYNPSIHGSDIELSIDNFDTEYENYVTPTAHKAIEDAYFYVKQSGNPNVTDLKLYELMYIRSVRPAFLGLVLSSMYGSYRPEAYQSVSKIAIGTINGNGAYYMEWFQKVVRNVNDEFTVPLPDKNGQGSLADDILA